MPLAVCTVLLLRISCASPVPLPISPLWPLWGSLEAVGGEQPETGDVAKMRVSAEAGDAAAQFELGRCYQMGGTTISRDRELALFWYRKAAEQGSAAAENNIGMIHAQGSSFPQAIAWLRKSADHGSATAKSNLGVVYAKLLDGWPDDAQAIVWFRKAAEGGLPDAMISLGDMYAAGRGAPRDNNEAALWYRKAVSQGASYTTTSAAKERLDKILRKAAADSPGKMICQERPFAPVRCMTRLFSPEADRTLGILSILIALIALFALLVSWGYRRLTMPLLAALLLVFLLPIAYAVIAGPVAPADAVLLQVAVSFVIVFHAIPSLIALRRRHRNVGMIALISLTLGFPIGWTAGMVMVFSQRPTTSLPPHPSDT